MFPLNCYVRLQLSRWQYERLWSVIGCVQWFLHFRSVPTGRTVNVFCHFCIPSASMCCYLTVIKKIAEQGFFLLKLSAVSFLSELISFMEVVIKFSLKWHIISWISQRGWNTRSSDRIFTDCKSRLFQQKCSEIGLASYANSPTAGFLGIIRLPYFGQDLHLLG